MKARPNPEYLKAAHVADLFWQLHTTVHDETDRDWNSKYAEATEATFLDFFGGFAVDSGMNKDVPLELACIWCHKTFRTVQEAAYHMKHNTSCAKKHASNSPISGMTAVHDHCYLMNPETRRIVSAPKWIERCSTEVGFFNGFAPSAF